MHGAPIISALASEKSGVDLVYLALPSTHAEIAKAASLNFQVHPFAGEELARKDLKHTLELLASIDIAVIGPGLARTKETLEVIKELVSSAPCPLVLDASALQSWTLKVVKGKEVILTPHLGELERMGIDREDIGKVSKEFGVTIHLKDRVDQIASNGKITKVAGGNAGLTVGGTGDALAGLIAGLLAQGLQPLEACKTASTVIKRAGTKLFTEKGFAYTTRNVICEIPKLLHSLSATASMKFDR